MTAGLGSRSFDRCQRSANAASPPTIAPRRTPTKIHPTHRAASELVLTANLIRDLMPSESIGALHAVRATVACMTREPDFDREIDDFFSGRRSLDARGMAKLIHAMNPTERGLGKKETARRYAAKARLQSEFVRRFEADLIVRVERDGVTLSIAHGPLGFDIGHVPETALDDDARSLARRLLDADPSTTSTQPSGRESSRSKPRPHSHGNATGAEESVLVLAQRAREQWDFDTARRLLESEVESRPSDLAVSTLLELLVDDLGDDVAAVRLGTVHRAIVERDAITRQRMASAHARSDDPSGAETWLRGTDPSDAPDAFARLGAAFLRTGDVTAGERIAARLRKEAPANVAALELERGIAARRREEAAQWAAELENIAKTDDAEATRSLATRVLALDATHERARSILARLDASAANARFEARRARVADALDRGERELARSWLVALRAEGSSVTELETRLAELDARAEVEDREVAATKLVRELETEIGSPSFHEALERYSTHDVVLRALVRSRAPTASEGHLDALEQVVAVSPRATPAERIAAVKALMAVASSGDSLRAAHALDALAPHIELLAKTKLGRDLRESLLQRRASENARDASLALERATRLLEAGDTTAASTALESFGESDLPIEARAQLASVRTSLADREHSARMETERARLLLEGWNFDAATLSRATAAATQSVDLRARWSWIAEQDETFARGELRALADSTEGEDAELSTFDLWSAAEHSNAWLDGTGRYLYIGSAGHERLTIREFDTERGMVTRRISVRIQGIDKHFDLVVTTTSLVVVGERNGDAYLGRVSRTPTGAPLRWVDVRRVATTSGKRLQCGTSRPLDDAHVLISADRHKDGRFRVVGVESAREIGRLPERSQVYVCPSLDAPLLVVPHGSSHLVHAHRLDGTRVDTMRPLGDAEVVACVADGAGERAYLGRDVDDGEVSIVRVNSEGAVRWSAVVPGSDGDMSIAFALDCQSRTLLVGMAFQRTGRLRVQPWDAPGPARESEGTGMHVLVTDVSRRLARVVVRRSTRIVCAEAAVVLDGGGIDEGLGARVSLMRTGMWCSTMRVEHLGMGLERDPYDALAADALVERVELDIASASSSDDVISVLARLSRFRRSLAVETATRLAAKYPDDQRVLLAKVDVDVQAERWIEARDTLVGASTQLFAGRLAHHATHLAAYVAIALGYSVRDLFPEAAAILARVDEETASECRLDRIRDLVDGDATAVAEIAFAMDDADACFAEGDFAAMRDALHRPCVFDAGERQCLARLAYAWLELAPDGVREKLMAWDVITVFVEGEHGLGYSRSGTLPRPIAHRWSEERIAETLERARAWMTAFGRGA